MPEISRFLGIVVGMFYSEHGVAHFHAVYGEQEVSVELESAAVHGTFPTRALQHVLEWAELGRETSSSISRIRAKETACLEADVLPAFSFR